MWWTICCRGILQMFSTSRDDKPAVHEKMKRRVQAFICEITQKGQQMGFETGGGGEELIMNGMFILTG